MTSEVAILNKAAIAVAADSAVTVGDNKVHTTANKIFLASSRNPIGFMIYGHADYSSVPWETIIKQFRSDTNLINFKTVEDCRKKFFEYLHQDRWIGENGNETNLAFFLSSVFEQLCNRFESMSPRERSQSFEKTISDLTDEFSNIDAILDFPAPSLNQYRLHYSEFSFQIANLEANKRKIPFSFPKRVRAQLCNLAYSAVVSNWMSPYRSGVVFFGFGDEEIMPTLSAYEVDGSPFGTLRYRQSGITDINRSESRIAILALADHEIVGLFMEGISTKTKHALFQFFEMSMHEVINRVIRENFSPNESEMKVISKINSKIVDNVISELEKVAQNYIHKSSVREIVQVVQGMPKEEMATLAEALVEISGLRKRVSLGLESVGGPVDVVIVTKGDGLVWVKRKHYFEIGKNLHYWNHPFGAHNGAWTGETGNE